MKITVALPDGSSQELEARAGATVMDAMRTAGIPVRAECGGAMACATCHVRVAPEWLALTGAAKGEEVDLLDISDYRADNSRLCCQIRLRPDLDGLKVDLQLDAFEG